MKLNYYNYNDKNAPSQLLDKTLLLFVNCRFVVTTKYYNMEKFINETENEQI